MKLIKYSTVLFLLFAFAISATAQTKPYKATAAQTAALKKQADQMAAAMVNQDFKQVIYFTYPSILQALGGKEKAQKTFADAMAQLQGQGVIFKSITIGNLNAIVKSGKDLYSVVPDILQLSVGGTVVTRGSSLLAISNDGGVRWYFVDTAPFKGQNLKRLFPTYPDGLVIPPTGGTSPGI